MVAIAADAAAVLERAVVVPAATAAAAEQHLAALARQHPFRTLYLAR